MDVAAFAGFGGADDVVIQQRPDLEPEANEAVITVESCSINRHDLRILNGESNRVSEDDLPFVTGLDLAGTVQAIGDEVQRVAPDDRVVLCPNKTCGRCEFCCEGPENKCTEFGLYHGGLAEQAVVEADRLLSLPDSVSTKTAASIPTAYMTAWHMLRQAEVEPGDMVLIPGGTGGVGTAAIELTDVVGATSIATSRSAEKTDRLDDFGADYALTVGNPEELTNAVNEIGTPDIVLNHLCGAYTRAGVSLLNRGGRMVICGRTVGDTSEFDVGTLFHEHLRIIGSTMGTQQDLVRLVRLLSNGELDPTIADTYRLSETAAAFRDMQSGEVFGKAIIKPQS
jgi:NADPH:quinone reductase-like Zn-dependent oxidoreductase